MCKGEPDLFGKIYRGPDRPLTRRSVPGRGAPAYHGGYTLQIDWADGHNDGIYAWETLRALARDEVAPERATAGAISPEPGGRAALLES